MKEHNGREINEPLFLFLLLPPVFFDSDRWWVRKHVKLVSGTVDSRNKLRATKQLILPELFLVCHVKHNHSQKSIFFFYSTGPSNEGKKKEMEDVARAYLYSKTQPRQRTLQV